MPISSNFRYLSNIYIWYFAQIQTLIFFMSLHKYREMALYLSDSVCYTYQIVCVCYTYQIVCVGYTYQIVCVIHIR